MSVKMKRKYSGECDVVVEVDMGVGGWGVRFSLQPCNQGATYNLGAQVKQKESGFRMAMKHRGTNTVCNNSTRDAS